MLKIPSTKKREQKKEGRICPINPAPKNVKQDFPMLNNEKPCLIQIIKQNQYLSNPVNPDKLRRCFWV